MGHLLVSDGFPPGAFSIKASVFCRDTCTIPTSVLVLVGNDLDSILFTKCKPHKGKDNP